MGQRRIVEYFCDRCEAQIMDESRVHYVMPPRQDGVPDPDSVELCADCAEQAELRWKKFMTEITDMVPAREVNKRMRRQLKAEREIGQDVEEILGHLSKTNLAAEGTRKNKKLLDRGAWLKDIKEQLRKNPHLIITNTTREDDRDIARIREEVRAEKASAVIHKAEILMAKKVRHDDDGA